MLTGWESSARNPYHRAESLGDLLDWNDVDFVRCAYVTVLGRQPDAAGEAHYTRRLRSGHAKLEILWQLRKSKEALNHDPGIAGFDRLLKRARLERAALVGPIVRLFTGGEGNDARWRRHRALLNQLERQAAHQVQLGWQVRGMDSKLESVLARLSNAEEAGTGTSGLRPADAQRNAYAVVELDSLSRQALKILQQVKAVA